MKNVNDRLIYKGTWTISVRKDFLLNPNLSIGAKLLYLAIKSYCGADGDTAYPSSTTLAKGLHISRDKVFRCAVELEEAGLLERQQSHASKKSDNEEDHRPGTFSHTIYTLYATESPKQRDEAIESGVPTVSVIHRDGETPHALSTVTVKPGANSLVPIIVEEKPIKKAPTPAKETVPSPYKAFSDAWCSAFQERFGAAYHYNGRDGKAATELLKAGENPEDLVALAKQAWSKMDRTKYWKCVNMTAHVWDFARELPAIRKELDQDLQKLDAEGNPKW